MSKTALVYGADGLLGNAVLEELKLWTTVGVTFDEPSNATYPIVLKNERDITRSIECFDLIHALVKEENLDIKAIVNCAGGFTVGNLDSFSNKTRKASKGNVATSLVCAQIASRHMKNGILILPGSDSSFSDLGMLYEDDMEKAGVSGLIQVLPKRLDASIAVCGFASKFVNEIVEQNLDAPDLVNVSQLGRCLRNFCENPNDVVSGKIYRPIKKNNEIVLA